jgi:DNA topoisomerase-2
MIMTDQDTDGSHIKGLIFNFFYNGWRDLLESGDFITSFRTPVLKVFLSQTAKQAKTNKTNKTDKKIKKIKEPSQQQQVLSFYNKQTYVAWAAANEDLAAKATVKYYKGLGTSTPKEGREYFADIANNQIRYNFTDDSGGALEKAFAENAKSRKEILSRYDENVVIDQSLNTLTYEEFVYQEFIHYMNDSNIRAIPTIDGLKEAQRKTIFAITRQALTNETKVTEAQSLISKMTRYHHGETSMHEAIIKMAQTYKGSNNINYLKPCGQFGTVLMGGADSSAPRYLFTCVSEYARAIFHPDDDDIYDQLEDEGQSIEPAHFFPVVPMSVVNGARGTGTGYSTYIPNFNPRDVITRIRAITKREPTDTLPPMVPWYRGFQGTIVRDTKGWLCTGVVERVSTTTVNITELPIGVWIEPYVEFLSQLRLDKKIKRYDNYCAVPDEDKFSDIQIGFKIVVDPDVVDTSDQAALISLFNLTVKLPDTNMNLLIKGRVQQFSSVEKILEMYYPMRLAFYARRRENVLRKMERQETIIRNRIRFLMAVGAGELKVQQARAVVVKALEDEKFDKVDGTHDYLLDMPIYSFTSEKTDALRRQLADQIEAIRLYRAETPESLWQRDLVALEAILP